MLQANLSPELLFHAVELIIIGIGGWVGLKTQNASAKVQAAIMEKLADVRDEQRKVKEELVTNQNRLHLEFNEKHAENRSGLAVHQASDDQQFAAISRTLNRMDGKLDKIANGH